MKTAIKFLIVLLVCGVAETVAAAPDQTRFSAETGRTTQPVEITLQSNGTVHGKAVLPADTLVRVLHCDGEQALIETRLGIEPVPSFAVRRTMEPVNFESLTARQAAVQPVRRCRPCPRRQANQQVRTASRSSAQPASSRQDPTSTRNQTAPGKINVTSSNPRFERTVFTLTNQARREQGLPALQWSESLARAARYHAAHMAKYRYFAHDTRLPDGRRMSPAERIAHFDSSYAGENIAWGQRTPQEAVKSWINSPGHRANMLERGSTRLGVGYVRGYWVQVFGR